MSDETTEILPEGSERRTWRPGGTRSTSDTW